MENVLLMFLLISISSCSITGDKLYIFKIDHIPVESDWGNALPYYVAVGKGKLNQNSLKVSKLDNEVIHTSSKTCHHTSPDTPVDIKLSAFYNNSDLFLRIQWPDKNKDDMPFDKTKGNEDGLGIIWSTDKNPSHNCSVNCHLSDWQVLDSRLSPVCQMRRESLNLWVWRAGGRSNIHSQSLYKNGFWTLTIVSPLDSFGEKFFQIAVFDNTYFDHSVTFKINEMVFLNDGIKQMAWRSQ